MYKSSDALVGIAYEKGHPTVLTEEGYDSYVKEISYWMDTFNLFSKKEITVNGLDAFILDFEYSSEGENALQTMMSMDYDEGTILITIGSRSEITQEKCKKILDEIIASLKFNE